MMEDMEKAEISCFLTVSRQGTVTWRRHSSGTHYTMWIQLLWTLCQDYQEVFLVIGLQSSSEMAIE